MNSKELKVSKRFYRAESALDLLEYLDHGEQAQVENRWTLEAAWEVANKVGNIYTVLRSKAFVSTEEMGDNYCLIGPYKQHWAHQEVELGDFPQENLLQVAVNRLREQGFNVQTGRWLVDGNPQIILLDIGNSVTKLREWKQELWEKTGISIPLTDVECNDYLIFGFLCALFISEFRRMAEKRGDKGVPPRIVAHFHEWMTGIAIIMLRLWKVDLATVLTTHSTIIGRSLCAGVIGFYDNLEKIDPNEEAGKRKMYHRYCIERVACQMANVFTTVSEITGLESQHFVKRTPDVITPNGLNVKKFAALHEFQNLHALSKEKINEFVRGHFYGHYDFNLEKTLYFFIAGRYEFENKGIDIFIEALARLNHFLKSSESDKTVVAFFIFPCKTRNFNVESLRGQALTKTLRETIQGIQNNIGKRLYETCLRERLPTEEDLLTSEEVSKIKRCIFSLQRQSLPPITTHNVDEDWKDPVMNAIRRCRLLNSVHDRVKVIFHPEFLSSTNPLFGLDYEEFVRGCHLGVFPSYYEPWGFTPAECAVMGIPSITTNLSGYGCFMAKHVADPKSYGIYIVDRRDVSLEESTTQLAKHMHEFCLLNRRQRIIQRNRTERLSDLLDWRNLGIHYRQARMMALKKVYSEFDYDDNCSDRRIAYPRPISEPSTPQSSRTASPNRSESDSVDSDAELEELQVGAGIK